MMVAEASDAFMQVAATSGASVSTVSGLFFVLPVLFVLSRFVGAFRSIPFSVTLLLVNFVSLLLIIAARFIWNLTRLRRDLRYGAAGRPGTEGETIPRQIGRAHV